MPERIDDNKVIKIRVKDSDFEHQYDHQGYNRMTEIPSNHSIYGIQDKINAEEIKKGTGGDHWLTTVLYEVALNDPNAIQNMIRDNQDGTVTVRFYKTLENGQKCPLDVIVDRSLPAVPGSDVNAPWIGLIEKAYAAGFNRKIMAEEKGEKVQVETGRFKPNMKFILQPGSPEAFLSALLPDRSISFHLDHFLIDGVELQEQKTSGIRAVMARNIAARISEALQTNDIIYAKTKNNSFPIVGIDDENSAFRVYDFQTGNIITYPVSELLERKAGNTNPDALIESIEIMRTDPEGKDRPLRETFDIVQIRTLASKLTSTTSRDPELFARIAADFFAEKLRVIYNNQNTAEKPSNIAFNKAIAYLGTSRGQKLLMGLSDEPDFKSLAFQSFITLLNDNIDNLSEKLMTALFESLRRSREKVKEPETETLYRVLFDDINKNPDREEEKIFQSKSERYPDIQYEDTDPVIVKEQDTEKSEAFLNTFMDAIKNYYAVMESIRPNLNEGVIHEGLQDISTFTWKKDADPAVYREYKDMDLSSFRDIYENLSDHNHLKHLEHVDPGQKNNTRTVRNLIADLREKAEQYRSWAKKGTHSDRMEEILTKFESLEELFDTRTSDDLDFLKNKMKLSFVDEPVKEKEPENEPDDPVKEEEKPSDDEIRQDQEPQNEGIDSENVQNHAKAKLQYTDVEEDLIYGAENNIQGQNPGPKDDHDAGDDNRDDDSLAEYEVEDPDKPDDDEFLDENPLEYHQNLKSGAEAAQKKAEEKQKDEDEQEDEDELKGEVSDEDEDELEGDVSDEDEDELEGNVSDEDEDEEPVQDEEPAQDEVSDNKTAILRDFSNLNKAFNDLQELELTDPTDGQMKKTGEMTAYKKFRKLLTSLVDETDQYYTMDEAGNYHPLDGDGLYRLLKLYENVFAQNEVLMKIIKTADKSLPGNEAIAAYDKLLQSTKKLLEKDIRILTGIGTSQAVILPDVIIDKRARHLEIQDHLNNLDTVGDKSSMRIPLTYTDENNIVHNGFFTEDKTIDFKTGMLNEIRKILADMAKKNKKVTDLLQFYFENVFSTPEIADNPERLRKAIVECGKNIADNGRLIAAECKNKNINWSIFGKDEASRSEEEKQRKIAYDDFNSTDPKKFQKLSDSFAGGILQQKAFARYLGPVELKSVYISRVNGTSIAQRNSAMSAVANLLGIGKLIAHSENMKVTIDGKEISGVFMENGEGEDLAKAKRGGFLEQVVSDEMSVVLEDSVKNDLFSLQILDYICNNVDRHQNNVLYKLDVDKEKHQTKIIGLQGIDNDLSFGTKVADPNEDPIGNELTIKDLKYIPAKTAAAIKALNPHVLDMTLKGFHISQAERKACLKRLQQIKHALLYNRILIIDEAKMKDVYLELYTEGVTELPTSDGTPRKVNTLAVPLLQFGNVVQMAIEYNEKRAQASHKDVWKKTSFKEASYQNSTDISEREKAAQIMSDFYHLLQNDQSAFKGYLESAPGNPMQNSVGDEAFKAVQEAIKKAGMEALSAENKALASAVSAPGLYSANYAAALRNLKEMADAYLNSVQQNGEPAPERVRYVTDVSSFARKELDNMDRIHEAYADRHKDPDRKNLIQWDNVNKQLKKMSEAGDHSAVDIRSFLRWKLYNDIKNAGQENFERIRYTLEDMNVDARNLMKSGPEAQIFFDSFTKSKNITFKAAKKCYEMAEQFKKYDSMLSDVESNIAALSGFYDKLQQNQNLDQLKLLFQDGKIPEDMSFEELTAKRLAYRMLSELSKHQAEFDRYKQEAAMLKKEDIQEEAGEENVQNQNRKDSDPQMDEKNLDPQMEEKDSDLQMDEENLDHQMKERDSDPQMDEENLDPQMDEENLDHRMKERNSDHQMKERDSDHQMRERVDDIIELADRDQEHITGLENPNQVKEQVDPEQDDVITDDMMIQYKDYISLITKIRDRLAGNESYFFAGKQEYQNLMRTLNQTAEILNRIYDEQKEDRNISKNEMENSLRHCLDQISQAGDAYMLKHTGTGPLSNTQSVRLEAISQLQLAGILFGAGKAEGKEPVSLRSDEATKLMIASKLISSLAARSLKLGLSKETRTKDGRIIKDKTYYHKLQSDKIERNNAIHELLREPEFNNMIQELKAKDQLFSYAYKIPSDKIVDLYDNPKWEKDHIKGNLNQNIR